ncbi:hypothetical protein Tco_0839401 [Tanacetum coccineum]|uniref:Uncharacterized protein n=1 Tax=Tanacetum coccineum TaxID=301880 RepID=A0ABQ5ASD1_9ASTR
MNKTRKVRSQEPKESSSTTQTQVALQTKQTTNKSLLSSTRVTASTSASRSQSKNNTRKNRITPAASSYKKNKVEEVHPRKIMSSPNKRNLVSMCNANFKHVVKDANSKFVCSTCNGCLFSANHDKCVVAYINDMNEHVNSKSGNRKKVEWKPRASVSRVGFTDMLAGVDIWEMAGNGPTDVTDFVA